MRDTKTVTPPPSATAAAARRLGRRASFHAVIAVMVLFQAASAAPAPLYVVYQRLWGFSAATLTLIFAIFVLGLLAALLMLGTLSDYLGRRTVLAAAIALELVALLLFLRADGVPMLLIARLAQGIATGMALPALSAALVDFNPPHAPGRAAVVSGVVPIGGLAFGALACSALVQYAPDPTRLVWTLLVGAMLAALLVAAALPEPARRRPGIAASLVPRLGVPRRLRGDVWALVPVIVASWALGGLYLSLGPSAVVTLFGLASHFLGGLEVALLCGTGAAAAFALRRRSGPAVARISTVLLTAGTALTLLGIVTDGAAGRRGRHGPGRDRLWRIRAFRFRLAGPAGRPRRSRRAGRAIRGGVHDCLSGFQPPGRRRRLCRDPGRAAGHRYHVRIPGHPHRAGGVRHPGITRPAPGLTFVTPKPCPMALQRASAGMAPSHHDGPGTLG